MIKKWDMRELTNEEHQKLLANLMFSGEWNLLHRLTGEGDPLPNCPRCHGTFIVVRSSWNPDLLKNPGSGEWGKSKPCTPYWAECKACTLSGIRAKESNTEDDAVDNWKRYVIGKEQI